MEELKRLTRELEDITGDSFYGVVFIDENDAERAKKNLLDLLHFFEGKYKIPDKLTECILQATK